MIFIFLLAETLYKVILISGKTYILFSQSLYTIFERMCKCALSKDKTANTNYFGHLSYLHWHSYGAPVDTGGI